MTHPFQSCAPAPTGSAVSHVRAYDLRHQTPHTAEISTASGLIRPLRDAISHPQPKGTKVMKLIATTAIIVALSAPAAFAWSDTYNQGGRGGDGGNATSIAAAKASASATAIAAQAQQQAQTQRATANNRNNVTSGSSLTVQDRRQAPSVSAPSVSGGGHPCAYGGFSFGLSVIGGGGSGGGSGNNLDDACLLGQLGYRDAAMSMIAARNPEARKALAATGHVRIAPAAPAVSTRSIPAQTVRVSYTSCEMLDNGAARVGVQRGASDAVKATAVKQCQSALGM